MISIDVSNNSTPEITLQVDSDGRLLYQVNHGKCSIFQTEDGEFGMSIQQLTDVCCVSKKKLFTPLGVELTRNLHLG